MPSPTWTHPTKRLATVGMVLVLLFVLYLARGVLTPFILGGLLALILSPLVEFLSRRFGWRRGFAVAGAYLLFVAVVAAIPLLIIPAFARSAASLDLVAIVDQVLAWSVRFLDSLRTITIFGTTIDLSSVIDPLIELLETGEGFDIDFGAVFGGAWGVASAIFTSVIGLMTTALLSIVISVYLSSAMHRDARAGVYRLVPEPYVPEVQILGARIARVWNDYLRGQLTVALLVGILTALIMFAIGMPGALIIGVIGGFFNIIPTFGPIFASVVAAIVALVQGSDRFDVSNIVFALIVVGAYTIIQQLESSVITPRILGGAVAVSPLAILLGILIGFSAAGILGAIVAVPVVATGREVFRYVSAKLVDRDPYPDGMPPPKRTMKDRIEKMQATANGRRKGNRTEGPDADPGDPAH